MSDPTRIEVLHRSTPITPEIRSERFPAWEKIDIVKDLPDEWHEEWLWPDLADNTGRREATMSLLEDVSQHLLHSGRVVWGDLEYLVQQGVPLDYGHIRHDDLTRLRLAHLGRHSAAIPAQQLSEPFIAVYNFGTVSRTPDRSSRATFTMRGGVIHAIMPEYIFSTISGYAPSNEWDTFRIEGGIVGVVTHSSTAQSVPSDSVHLWLWPQPIASTNQPRR